jgi:hypothetical protein
MTAKTNAKTKAKATATCSRVDMWFPISQKRDSSTSLRTRHGQPAFIGSRCATFLRPSGAEDAECDFYPQACAFPPGLRLGLPSCARFAG